MKILFAAVVTLALTASAWAGSSCTTQCSGGYGSGSSTGPACYTTCN